MGHPNLINPPAPFSMPERGPSHIPSCTLVLSEESLEPYLLALSATLRPCFGHSLYITYLVSLQYLVHPCCSPTSLRSPWSTVCTTSGKYNLFFSIHMLLCLRLNWNHPILPNQYPHWASEEWPTKLLIPDLKTINAKKQQQQNRNHLSLNRGNLELQQTHNP